MQKIPSSRPIPEPDDFNTDHNRNSFSTYLLKPDADCVVKKPSWSGKDTVIRPYPCVHHTNPKEFWPYRIDAGGSNTFGYWIKKFYCAWSVGNPTVTFLIKHDPNYGSVFDVRRTPLNVLYYAISKACREGQGKPEWYVLLNGDRSNLRSLRAVSECSMIQGALMRHDSIDLFGPGDPPLGFGNKPPVILVMSGGLTRTLVEMLSLENDGFRGDPDDFENRYVHGDPVALENGRYFQFFERGYEPDRKYASSPVSPGFGAFTQAATSTSSRSFGGHQQLRGFDIRILKEYSGIPANSLKDHKDIVLNKWRHWEDVLYFPNYVEQAHILASVFPASAILYAFSSYPEWIPDDVKRKAVNPVSVNFFGIGGEQAGPGLNVPQPGTLPGYKGTQQPAANPGLGQQANPTAQTGFAVSANPWESLFQNLIQGQDQGKTHQPQVDESVPLDDLHKK